MLGSASFRISSRAEPWSRLASERNGAVIRCWRNVQQVAERLLNGLQYVAIPRTQMNRNYLVGCSFACSAAKESAQHTTYYHRMKYVLNRVISVISVQVVVCCVYTASCGTYTCMYIVHAML